jgi:hypothetical protein
MSLENAYTVLYNSSDVEVGTATTPLRIDPTGTTTQPVSGTVTANQGTAAAVAGAWPILVTDGTDTAAVTNATPGAGDFGLVVRVAGAITTTEAFPATSTVTSVAVTAVNTNLLASNANRRGAFFWNNGSGANGAVYIKLGTIASATDFTLRLSAQSFYELQQPNYTGNIDAIRQAAGTSNVLVTELSP